MDGLILSFEHGDVELSSDFTCLVEVMGFMDLEGMAMSSADCNIRIRRRL